MMKKTVTLFFTAACLCLGASSFLVPAHAAQETPSLLVSPYEEVATVSKGSVATFTFTLRNASENAQHLSVSFVDFKAPSNKSGTPIYFTPTSPDPSYYPDSWLSTQNASFVVQPNVSITVPITLSVPENASPGGHYGGIEFQSIEQSFVNGNGIAVNSKIAVPVLITVNGQLKEQIVLNNLQLSRSVLASFAGLDGIPSCGSKSCLITATATFTNQGNVHEAPYGTVILTNFLGQTVYDAPFNATKGYILPNTPRAYTIAIPYDKISGIHFGAYTLHLAVAYGMDTKYVITATTGLWLVNYTDLLVFVILILIIASAYGFNRYNKGKIKNRYL